MEAENIQDIILKNLSKVDSLDSADVQKEYGLTHEAMYAELVSLVALNYIKLENKKTVRQVLTAEGVAYS